MKRTTDLCFSSGLGAKSPGAPTKSVVVCNAEKGRGVVVTGGTKGIGFAMARKFASLGHRVVICGRSEDSLRDAMEVMDGNVYGISCDVSEAKSVESLANFATEKLGRIDIWINNAGSNAYSRRDLRDLDPEQIKEVVETNMLGSLLCSRQALRTLESQDPAGGHIFNMEGAGSFGDATATYAAYGATKSSIPQLTASLVEETKKSPVGCHILSPGMVLTDLLLSDSTVLFRRFFNLIAEEPDTVAENIVPRILEVSGTNKKIRFLTVPGAFLKIVVNAIFNRNKFFDDKGERIPGDDSEFDEQRVKKQY
ncbi:hypothetical protein NDN08_002381 [Rhodosorus marinus]|uniref:Chlorophyll(Ide) b reductase n=1 Tax=Rhodosorus marinus TaxID=101924 RepID=A0AAV8UXZ4_9RHOD|nr:hypothetical protein NDN08_002381 [Rhodosorus marinus]